MGYFAIGEGYSMVHNNHEKEKYLGSKTAVWAVVLNHVFCLASI